MKAQHCKYRVGPFLDTYPASNLGLMVGWEVSRHPEWDMMYTAGLTVREICDLCHQVPATVHLHVRVREKYEPGYQAKHEAALNARGPHRPTTQWRQCLAELTDFYTAKDRLPTANSDYAECSLHRWLWVQRRAFDAGNLPDSKVALLQKNPGWNERAHCHELDLHWLETLNQFKAFVDVHGFMPRYKTYDSEAKHALGVWLHNQHQMRTKLSMIYILDARADGIWVSSDSKSSSRSSVMPVADSGVTSTVSIETAIRSVEVNRFDSLLSSPSLEVSNLQPVYRGRRLPCFSE